MLLILCHYQTVARLREPNSFGCEELGAEDETIQGGASGLVKLVSKKSYYLLEMSSLLLPKLRRGSTAVVTFMLLI